MTVGGSWLACVKSVVRIVATVGFLILAVLRGSMYMSALTYSESTTKKITCDGVGANETCLDPVGVVGEWVRVGRNRSFDAPFCCGRPTTAWGCPDFFDEYEWRSPHIPPRFDPVETCRLLGNSTVLLAGDSTMDQFHGTLVNALWPGKCHAQVKFAQSDTLTGLSYGNMNRGKPWEDLVDEFKPDIMIVTVGAHVLSDDATYADLIETVIYGMHAIQQEKKNIKFAWKTQNPGGCSKDISSPNNATMAAKELDVSVANYGKTTYNWYQFYNRDLNLLSRLQQIGIPYLDMRMLYSRSDAHISSQTGRQFIRGVRDCLHMCLPGPLDVAGRLFHQLLLDIKDDNNNAR